MTAPVDELLPAAREMISPGGDLPSVRGLKDGLRVGTSKAQALRKLLDAERDETPVRPSRPRSPEDPFTGAGRRLLDRENTARQDPGKALTAGPPARTVLDEEALTAAFTQARDDLTATGWNFHTGDGHAAGATPGTLPAAAPYPGTGVPGPEHTPGTAVQMHEHAVPGDAAVPGAAAPAGTGVAGGGNEPGTGTARRARRESTLWIWPIALPAAVAIWSGWVGLGEMAGFGIMHPLPGIWDEAKINTAITLPIGMEAYAAWALKVWISGRVPRRARVFAAVSAVLALLIGCAGQIAYHQLAAAGANAAPNWLITGVACLPVAVLGMAVALAHLIRADQEN